MEESPGGRRIAICPNVHYDLRRAEAVYDSAVGQYACSWEIMEDNRIRIKITIPFGGEGEVRLPHAPEILFEDKTNPLFATVVNGICYITAGNYEVVYEATEKLKKIYSVESKLEDLLNHPQIRAFLSTMTEVDMIPDAVYGCRFDRWRRCFPDRWMKADRDVEYSIITILTRREQMSEKSKNKRLVSWKKWDLFMVCAGNIPLMGLLSGFFMIYYTNVVGLEPAALATLFLISKVVDGISDPIMGYFLDKFPVTKMGKFRPMIILGTIICVINYILLWFGAVWIPVGKYVIVYVTYLLLGWTFDIMDISKNSLLPVMSADDKERNSLSLFNALGTMIGSDCLQLRIGILDLTLQLRDFFFAGVHDCCI